MDKLNEDIFALQVMIDSLENHLQKIKSDLTDLPSYKIICTKYENLIWELNANKRKLDNERKYL